MRQAMSKTRLRVSLRWPRRLLGSDQHLEEHWPRGAKIKMNLERATPKGKVVGGEANGKSQYWALLEEFYSRRIVKGFPL